MKTITDSAANKHKMTQAETAWDQLLGEALRKGFFGTAAIELCVQDGTIQHIRRRVERLEK